MVNKKMTGYVLKVAKGGPKLRVAITTSEAVDSAAAPGPQSSRALEFKMGEDGLPILPEGPGLALVSMKNSTRLRLNGETLARFAEVLSDQLREPIVDGTRLGGRYDITLTWTSDLLGAARSSELSPWPPLEEALVSQLGLKLQREKITALVLIVDHVERTPKVE